MNASTISDEELSVAAKRAHDVLQEVQRVYVGPKEVVELMMVGLMARGHVLLEGVPGVAKTTLVKAFATALGCSFRRIQFTPDLLPADITGTYVLSPNEGTFVLRQGPIFTNVVLGDEINRAPSKTQSALLEAMQEHQVTIEGETKMLPSPFIVLATQNPVEQAGTYPLPEAQIDRFLIRIAMSYPSEEDEVVMLNRFSQDAPEPKAILNPEEVLSLQSLVSRVHVEPEIMEYIVRLARYTREHARLFLGASPRASLALLQACRARALLLGRAHILPDDVKILAESILAHRLVRTPEAEMEGIQTGDIVQEALRRTSLRHQVR